MTAPALPTLRTPRLTLRPLQASDADAIVDGVGNYDVSRWLGVVPYPYTRADAEAFLASVDPAKRFSWAIDAGDGLIGVMSVGERLGYWLARPAWRKGYGFEAAVAALNHWFSATDAKDVGVGHFEGNDRSAAVIEALGFAFYATGTTYAKSLQQEVGSREYMLTRDVWEARQTIDIRTERLRLRPLVNADAAFLADLARPEVCRMLFSLKPGLSLPEARNFIAARRWQGVPGYALAIEKAGKTVGYIATGSGQGVELYYALHPDHWGQGLMTEAARAFLKDVFARFPVSKLVADRFEDNPASGHLLEKCGFVETGRDMGHSAGRLEPAPVITYALSRDNLRA